MGDAYQNEKLLTECWSKVKNDGRWDQEHDTLDQIVPGYCGFATINCLLSASYKQRVFLKYPTATKPISLTQMRDIIVEQIMNDKTLENEISDIRIVSVEAIRMNPNEISLNDFEGMIKELDTVNVVSDDEGKWQEIIYYGGNFSRQPLFFCNLTSLRKRFLTWLIGGHFSPIITYCYDTNNEMYVLIADTNRDRYGNWLVRVDRLYEAMKYLEFGGNNRGLLKMKIRKKIVD